MHTFEVGQAVMFEGLSDTLYVQFIDGEKITCAYVKDGFPCTVTLNAKSLKPLSH